MKKPGFALLALILVLAGCDNGSTEDTKDADKTEDTGITDETGRNTWPPNNPKTAQIQYGGTQVRNEGSIAKGEIIWYKAVFTTGQKYIIWGVDRNLTLFNAAERASYADIVIDMYDSGGNVVQSGVDIGNGQAGPHIERTFAAGSTYYIKMSAPVYGGDYIMDIFYTW